MSEEETPSFANARRLPAWACLFWVISFMTAEITPVATAVVLRSNRYGYFTIGVVLTLWVAGAALTAPLVRLLMRRADPRHVLAACAGGFAIGFIGLIVLVSRPAGAPDVCAAALVSAAFTPRVRGVLHELWRSSRTAVQLPRRAYVAEAALAQVAPVLGGGLVVVLGLALSPTVALAGAGGCCTLGTLGLLIVAPVRPAATTPVPRRDVAVAPTGGLGWLILAAGSIGAIVGVNDLAVPAFAEAHGSLAQSGAVLLAFAFGSLLGGLTLARGPASAVGRAQRTRMLVTLPVAFAAPLVATSLAALLVIFLIAGIAFSRACAAVFSLTHALHPGPVLARGQALTGAACTGGGAAGCTLAGLLTGRLGPTAALAASSLLALLAATAAGVPDERSRPSHRGATGRQYVGLVMTRPEGGE